MRSHSAFFSSSIDAVFDHVHPGKADLLLAARPLILRTTRQLAYCQYLVTICFSRRHNVAFGFAGQRCPRFPQSHVLLVSERYARGEPQRHVRSLLRPHRLDPDHDPGTGRHPIKVRSLRDMAVSAELLILLGIAVVLFNVIDIALPEHSNHTLHVLDAVVENAGLAFVFIFRFYFLGLSKDGWRLPKTRHRELFVYGLYVTHGYPFVVLNHVTGLSSSKRMMLVACFDRHCGVSSDSVAPMQLHTRRTDLHSKMGFRLTSPISGEKTCVRPFDLYMALQHHG